MINPNLITILDDIEYVGQNFCEETNVVNALRVVGYLLLIARLVIPFAIIFYASLDLIKSVMSGETSDLLKQLKVILVRILIGAAVFFIPVLIDIVFQGIEDYSNNQSEIYQCEVCLLRPRECDGGAPSKDEADIHVKKEVNKETEN